MLAQTSWYRAILDICVGGIAGFVALFTAPLSVAGAVVVEEMLKWMGIQIEIGTRGLGAGMRVGLGFALTEIIFYLSNMLMYGGGEWWLRGLTSLPLHIVCGGLIARYRYGLAAAIVIHLIYNWLMR